MNLLHAATVGTDDYHQLMQAVLPHAWKAQAGYVPQVAPEAECSLPEIIYQGHEIINAMSDDYWWILGQNRYIIVDMRLCVNCRYNLSRAFDTIYFRYHPIPYTHCDICDSEDNPLDDIPF